MAVTLLALSALVFVASAAAGGDPLDRLRLDPAVPQSTVEQLEQRYGLDESVPVRYWRWLSGLVRGDWGYSIAYKQPVAPLLARRLANTLLLTAPAMLLAWLAALLWAALAVFWSRDPRGRFLMAMNGVLLALPDLLIALVLLRLHLATASSPSAAYVFPVLALVLAVAPGVARQAAESLRYAERAPYLESLWVHGAPRGRILLRHALPLAAAPLVSLAGVSFGALLGSSLIIELLWDWPGLGPLLVNAVQGRDVHVVVATTLASATLLLLGNALADWLNQRLDPRLRR